MGVNVCMRCNTNMRHERHDAPRKGRVLFAYIGDPRQLRGGRMRLYALTVLERYWLAGELDRDEAPRNVQRKGAGERSGWKTRKKARPTVEVK